MISTCFNLYPCRREDVLLIFWNIMEECNTFGVATTLVRSGLIIKVTIPVSVMTRAMWMLSFQVLDSRKLAQCYKKERKNEFFSVFNFLDVCASIYPLTTSFSQHLRAHIPCRSHGDNGCGECHPAVSHAALAGVSHIVG